jgi:hypothetical protein
MGTLFLAIALSIAVCMLHAAITRRWSLVQGGVPLLAGAALLALLAAVT